MSAPNLIKLAFTQPIRKRPFRAKRYPYTYFDCLALIPWRFFYNELPIYRYLCYGFIPAFGVALMIQSATLSPSNIAAFKAKKRAERDAYERKFETIEDGKHH